MFTPALEDRDLGIELRRRNLEIDPVVSINAIFYRAANNVYNYTDFTSKVLSINTSAPSTDATEHLWSGLGQTEWRLFDSFQSDVGTLDKSVASNGVDKFMAGEVLPSLKAFHAAVAYELNVLKGLNAKIVALEREGEQIAFLQKQLNLTHQVLDKLYIEKTSDLAAQLVLFDDWTGIYTKLEDGIGFLKSLHQPQRRTPRDPDIYDVVLGIQNITELVPYVTDLSFALAVQALNETNFNITDAAAASTLGPFYQTMMETWAIANVSTPVRIYDYHALEGSLWALRGAVYKGTEFFRDHKETIDKANYGQSIAFMFDTTQHLITKLIYAIMDLTIRGEGDEVFAIYIDIDERLIAAVELFDGGEVPEQGLVQAFIEEHMNGGNA